MDDLATALLKFALLAYVAGAGAGLLFLRSDRAANLCAFGCGALAGLAGIISFAVPLFTSAPTHHSFQIVPSLLPYVQFTVRLDPLGAFFGLIVSLLAVALSVYSLGYAHGFYGRKNVGVLGALFNVLLLFTTLVFLADNAFFFLIVWEIMALTAYCLVSYEHEKEETRRAGVLYFVMSHIGTGCLILGFLLLFQASGGYGFDGFHALGGKMAAGPRNAAFLFFLAGFGVKAGIVPLHIWLPAAGPVLHSTHTRNMEEMGGLAKRMPQTALFFLIGAVAISALPPLNGFVSEWLTYQSLLQGYGTTSSLIRLMFPFGGAMLALTSALAAACFVKA